GRVPPRPAPAGELPITHADPGHGFAVVGILGHRDLEPQRGPVGRRTAVAGLQVKVGPGGDHALVLVAVPPDPQAGATRAVQYLEPLTLLSLPPLRPRRRGGRPGAGGDPEAPDRPAEGGNPPHRRRPAG